MRGLYNGASMRAFKILPRDIVVAANLSPAAIKRLSWFDYCESHGGNISLTCRHFGISRDTFYLWRRKFNPKRLVTLEDDTKTRRPKTVRVMTTPIYIQDLICTIRSNDPEKSKYEIQAELSDIYGVKIGYNTVQKVINRHPELKLINVNHLRGLRKHRKFSIARIRAAYELKDKFPGSLIQIDTKHLYILGKRFYLFVAVDCKTRLGFIHCYKTGSSLNAADFILKTIKFFPFKIEAINTDNGSEYLLNFHKLCISLGITHYFSYPHTPKMNSRAERLIQTATYEFFNWQDDLLDDINEINIRCIIFNQKYNTKRYHQSLGYKTPMQYLQILQEKKGDKLYVM
jgi:transposase InsO family protein